METDLLRHIIVQFQDIRGQQIIKNNNRDQIGQISYATRVRSQLTCLHISSYYVYLNQSNSAKNKLILQFPYLLDVYVSF